MQALLASEGQRAHVEEGGKALWNFEFLVTLK